jgi:hypothetical protein
MEAVGKPERQACGLSRGSQSVVTPPLGSAFARSRRRRRTLAAAVITALASGVLGCGGSSGAQHGSGAKPVVQVGSRLTLTKAEVAKWTESQAILTYAPNPVHAVPAGVVPDPPKYELCTRYLAAHPTLSESPPNPTPAALRQSCAKKYEAARNQALETLITTAWTEAEAGKFGIHPKLSEAHEIMVSRYKPASVLRRFLRFTKLTEAQEEYLIRRTMLGNALLAHFEVAAGKNSSAVLRTEVRTQRAMAAEWKPQTICQPGYVMSLCSEYRGPG